jgi:hypothetical protein
VVLAWHSDHIGGPARRTNIKPIFDVAPPCCYSTLFHARWCALWRMVHWWRIVKLSVILIFFMHGPRSIFEFTTNIQSGHEPIELSHLQRKE